MIECSEPDIWWNEVGRHPHYVYSVIHHFYAKCLEPSLQSEFWCWVRAAAWQTSIACDRRYADHGAISFDYWRKGKHGAVNGSVEVNVHHFLYNFDINILYECAHADAGIINEYVDSSKNFYGRLDEAFAILFFTLIASYGVEKCACVAHLKFV